ncbi:hypothetical protein ACFLYD_03705 [Chloroflexota bacterium]
MNLMLGRQQTPHSPRECARFPWLRMATLVALVLTALFWTTGRSESVSLSSAVARAQQADLDQLPITFPVQSPEVAAYFHEIARPEDIASVPPSQLFLLPQDTVGQKMVAFRSWTEAQSELDTLIGPVELVMYNPEHWELTPEDEQQDLATTVQQFADMVHARGMRFMFAPDRQYAEVYLSQVAPYVDAVMLQGQRLQHDPQTFAAWVLGMTEMAHTANPDIQVFVQVGATRGTASEMFTAIQTVAGDIDGIAVWSMPRTLHILQEFVTLVREPTPIAEATPVATSATAPGVPVSTESPTALPLPATPATAPVEGTMVTSTQSTASPPPDQGGVPASTPEGVTTETSLSPVAPAPMPSPVQIEPVASTRGWLTDLLLFVGGMGIGCLVGFALGWGLGHRARG